MVKVKVCGMTNERDVREAVELKVWAVGFIFVKDSRRYIFPKKAKELIRLLTPEVLPVGVFVNEKKEAIKKIVNFCGLKAVQLHGDESPDFCLKMRQKKWRVIKAFRVGPDFRVQDTESYQVDWMMFDAFSKKIYGGTGKTFDWKLLRSIKNKRRLILSGGLNPENVSQAIRMVQPFAVDVSSGIERQPGVKCHRKMTEFFNNIRQQT